MSTAAETDRTHGAAFSWSATAMATTILLGAFLLFQVQPVVSKAILPWYGGSPAVWTTCMLFFQVLLFGGYVYAHLLQLWLRPRHQAAVHLALVAVAAVMLPVVRGAVWKPTNGAHPTLQILILLAATVGLPYFALAATSPLVQAWFGRTSPHRSPYRLYALSNLGSLAALLSYPFLIEPAMDVSGESAAWTGAFLLYGVFCAVCLACVWQCGAETGKELGTEVPVTGHRPSQWDRFRWLALPAMGSLMLLAATNHICQDVAVVPLLWVVPLALYLLSFIVCFDHSRWYVRPLWTLATLVALAGAAGNDILLLSDTRTGLLTVLEVYLAAMFCTCMVCHGELARLKPSPEYLTEFYLMIAAGGALGGLFVGIVAPLLFSTYFEWSIAVAISALIAFGLLILPRRKSAVAGSLAPTTGRAHSCPVRTDNGPIPPWAIRWRLDFLFGRWMRRARFACFGLASGAGLAYLTTWGGVVNPPLDRARNFFGVVTVRRSDDRETGSYLYLLNGRITHGRQFLDKVKRRWPTSYYGEQSGIGRAIRQLQKSGPLRLGAVGLGTGTIAAYAKPGDAFCFYEINPAVIRIATRRFAYLSDCRGAVDVVLGDARLSLEAEPPQQYNILALDAFSGDAIPTHLLTREAFAIYRRHLAPNGVIAVHVSNNYLRLAPVVERLAEDAKMRTTRVCQDCSEEEQRQQLLNSNEWVLVTEDDAFLRANPLSSPPPNEEKIKAPLWTDRYSNLFQILSSR